MSSELLIQIPKRLNEKLCTDPSWSSKVSNVINNIKDLLITTPTFFPEYTNHGIIHVNHVLDISDKLIPDITLKNLSPKALGIYLISAMLHDIGMFINYDEFKKLIDNTGSYTKVSPLDNKTLKEHWEAYLSELRRFSGKTLVRKFGTTDIKFTELPPHSKMNSTDVLVIGEFIRRHHHSISQYVILHGLKGNDLLKNTGIESDDLYRKIIGITARSHGMNVRDTEAYLERNFTDARRPNDIAIYYLMCVLRLADYLDAGEERASHIIESMFVKHSETSKKEYSWNQCIRYEDYGWNGSEELLNIEAQPNNPEQFINVEKWLNSVQNELDLCWAIIGENYGLNEQLLTIRRINSNILKKSSIEEYERKFYTKPVSLSANPDILKHLIKPLYGDNPSYGVRELIQNATDACKERKERSRNYDGDVIVSLDTENKVLTVKDNGVGMSIDTIVNYYLSTGSTYRNSDEWAKSYSDSRGRSKVTRNGKFGVGVLATFLLGESATITTRHVDDELGWSFSIQLNQDNIEIKRTEADIGTTVSVELSSMAVDKLMNNDPDFCPSWDEWYFDDSPKVSYYLNNEVLDNVVPDTITWHTLKQKEYKNYRWGYGSYYEPDCVCNGIVIPKKHFFNFEGKYRFQVRAPKLRIEDTEGRLPVNLSRSELFEIPCQEELYAECCKFILAKVLTANIKHINESVGWRMPSGPVEHGKFGMISSRKGYILSDVAFMKHAGIQHLNVLYSHRFSDVRSFPIVNDMPFVVKLIYDVANTVRELLTRTEAIAGSGVSHNINYIFADPSTSNLIQDYMQRGFYNASIFRLSRLKRVGKYDLLASSNLPKIEASDSADLEYPVGAKLELRYIKLRDDDIMLDIVKRYIPSNTFIPYDLEERKKLFPKAFEELKEYMND